MFTSFEEQARINHLIWRLKEICNRLDLPEQTEEPSLWLAEAKALVRAFSDSERKILSDMITDRISGGANEEIAIIEAIHDSWMMWVRLKGPFDHFYMAKNPRKTFAGASKQFQKQLLAIARKMSKASYVAQIPYAMRQKMSDFLKHVIRDLRLKNNTFNFELFAGSKALHFA